MVDLTEIYYVLAATGMLVAAIYYTMSLRYNMRARAMEICRLHTQDFVSEEGMRRYTTVMNMEWNDYEDFMKKYGPSNTEMFPKFVSHFMMMEASGILIKSKVVKPELFYDLGGYGAMATWEKFKDVIQRSGKEFGRQGTMRNADFFVQEIQKISAARFKDVSLESSKKVGEFSSILTGV